MGGRTRASTAPSTGPSPRPRSRCGRVYALDPAGRFLAADLATGRRLWEVDLPAREGATRPEMGFTSSPVVAAGVVILQTGAKGGSIAGFDPATGERRWSGGRRRVQYQTPVVVRVGAREVLVAAGDAKLDRHRPRHRPSCCSSTPTAASRCGSGAPAPSPCRPGTGRVFVKTHVDDSTMYRLAEGPDGGIAIETLWKAPVLRQTYGLPVYHDGFLYGMNGRTVWTGVDAATGEMKWRTREPGDGWPTLVGDQVVFVTKAGTLHVGPASPQGWTRARAPRPVRRPGVDRAHGRRSTPSSRAASASWCAWTGRASRRRRHGHLGRPDRIANAGARSWPRSSARPTRRPRSTRSSPAPATDR